MNKPPHTKPPQIETSDVEKLDMPLTNRAFFLGVSYLVQVIGTEGALEAPPENSRSFRATATCASPTSVRFARSPRSAASSKS